MPARPQRPCKHTGCKQLTREEHGFCGAHLAHHEPWKSAKERPAYHRWYGSTRWKKAREVFLLQNPLCAECMRHDVLRPAVLVDHIESHRGDRIKFWDKNNWQSLCKRCHDRKTAKEDGGFNNPRKKRECL